MYAIYRVYTDRPSRWISPFRSFCMKKIGMFVALALAASSVAVFAQTAPAPVPYGPQAFAPVQAQSVKVEGKLALINGIIGIKSGTKTYYLRNVGRLAGFVDWGKEWSSVKVEGYEYPLPAAPDYSVVQATKLTVGGKDYDLGQYGGFGGAWGHRGGMRGGMGYGPRW